MSRRCKHPDARPSRFHESGWDWCPDCRRHVPSHLLTDQENDDG